MVNVLNVVAILAAFVVGVFSMIVINIIANRLVHDEPIIAGDINFKNEIDVRALGLAVANGILFVILLFRFGDLPSLNTKFHLCETLDITLNVNLIRVLGLATIYAFVIMVLLLALVDHMTMLIPHIFIYIIAVISVISFFTMPGLGIVSRIVGVFCTSVPLLIITLIIPGAFGFGDIKLVAVSGFLLGTKISVMALFIGIIVGGVYGVFLMASGKVKSGAHMPFGPFLCIGFIISMIVGNDIADWYLGMFTMVK